MRLPKATRNRAFAFLAGLCAACPVGAASVEYLYVNASEGTASGGHVALKLGDEVFHFQHVPPGLLRITRDGFTHFREQYGGRENRTIRLHRVEVSDGVWQRLREHFNRIRWVEEEQFDRRDSLQSEARLLKALLARDGAAESLRVNGLGLFFDDGWDPAAAWEGQPLAPTLAELARRVEAAYGEGFLANRATETLAGLKALRPDAYDSDPPALAEGRFQAAAYSFADRYVDHLAGLAALQALMRGMGLREGVLQKPEGAEFRLDQAERQGLARYRAALLAQLAGLFGSQRPDWGFAVLIGMARLMALDESIHSGRLVFLGSVPLSTNAAAEVGADDADAAPLLLAELAEAKAGLGEAEVDEWAYVRVERAANRWFEVWRLRQQPSCGVCRKPGFAGPGFAAWPVDVKPVPLLMDAASLQARLDRLQAYREAYEARLATLYRYDLLGRNCASEVFRAIDAASLEGGLGGEIPAVLAFIPFLSFDRVGKSWPVVATEELPSYRHRRVEQAKLRENPLWVELRESNVFSSRVYEWRGQDAAFVFFTDGTPWIRPLAGGVNLAAGLAQGVYGLFAWPWDNGGNLWQGTKGALVSLPELVFFNIRKGSFPGLPVLPR